MTKNTQLKHGTGGIDVGKLIFPAYLLGILLMLSGAGTVDMYGLCASALWTSIAGAVLITAGAWLSEVKRRHDAR